MRTAEEFVNAATHQVKLAPQRVRIQEEGLQFQKGLKSTLEQYANLPLAKERAAYYKWKVLESLDKYLIEFEANVIRRGGKVIWAMDADSANAEIDTILRKSNAKRIVKSKTTLAEEIEMTAYLSKKGHVVEESHMGDFVAGKSGKPSFHMHASVMQLSASEISRLLNEEVGVSIDSTPALIARDIREAQRENWIGTEVMITGANFLIAENGMIALTENEGNIRMGISFAKTHIVLAGIDKIIPAMNDLDIYFPLLAAYGTSEKLNAYNSIVGPRQPGEMDGPAEFIVVLIDNGRSNLLAQPDQRQSLSCIRCGACSQVCPVFQTVGGDAFQFGPIGAVMAPHMSGLDDYKHLSYASPLCGKCTDVCPVKIDLHNHLLRNRRDSVQQGFVKNGDKLMWYSWKKMMLNRKNMNRGASVKNFMLKSFFKSAWGEQREFPKITEKSFNQMWRERTGQH